MIISKPPVLPFTTFKWRWASVAPTEGLNEPTVFLGALRAFAKYEGSPPNSRALLADLAKVQRETESTVDLVRTPERNLIRNSGQYWKALGLLEASDPVIRLTQYGRDVASGKLTMADFAATSIATMQLPNTAIQRDYPLWEEHGIRFKPLELILCILAKLQEIDFNQRYITKYELVKIVEPISAFSTSIDDFVDTILAYRQNQLSLVGWPDCAPAANDHRMAGEFLLFLVHYGYCSKISAHDNWHDKFVLEVNDLAAITAMASSTYPNDLVQAAKLISDSGLPDFVEHQRIFREVLTRPNQQRFRKDVLRSAHGTCLITGTRLSAALEAAHIIPFKEKGGDQASNGFCMRSDIHTLFDNGHLRISPSGQINLSELAQADPVYRRLPTAVNIPPYINLSNVQWRWNYM